MKVVRNTIFIIEEERAIRKTVKIVHKEPGFVYLKGNISNGQKVVISRLAGIGEGIKLESK